MGAAGCETHIEGREPLGFVMCWTAGYGTARYPQPKYRIVTERELFEWRLRALTSGPQIRLARRVR